MWWFGVVLRESRVTWATLLGPWEVGGGGTVEECGCVCGEGWRSVGRPFVREWKVARDFFFMAYLKNLCTSGPAWTELNFLHVLGIPRDQGMWERVRMWGRVRKTECRLVVGGHDGN